MLGNSVTLIEREVVYRKWIPAVPCVKQKNTKIKNVYNKWINELIMAGNECKPFFCISERLGCSCIT